MKSPEARPLRALLIVLLAMDVAIAIGIARLPVRLILPAPATEVPLRSPGLAAITPDAALFVTTGAEPGSDTVLVRVPLAPNAAPAQRTVIGHDLALHEPVQGMNAFMPSGARFAWNGRVLLIAAPGRGLGNDTVTIAVIGSHGLVAPAQTVNGTRPSCGWAGDHFEVAYVTPAPPPDVGRVQWVVNVSDAGVLSDEHIVEAAGVAHRPLAWPHGMRTATEGAEPNQWMLGDGTVVTIPHVGEAHSHPYAILGSDGSTTVQFTASERTSGSALSGEYAVRVQVADVTVEAELGTQRPRLRYRVTRHGAHVAFETENEILASSLLAVVRGDVLHLVDARGFHVRLRANDLAPLDPTMPKLVYLAGMLGGAWFGLAILGLVLAHALAIVVERGARGQPRARRIARLAGLLAIFFAGAVALTVWSAV